MTRRELLQKSVLGTAASLVAKKAESAEARWPIGCFNRPWGAITYDQALDGMETAGFKLTGFIGGHRDEPFTAGPAKAEYLDALEKRLRERDIRGVVTALRFHAGAPRAEALADIKKQVDNAARLQVPNVMTFGVDGPEHYEWFYRLMAETATYAGKRGIRLVMKPHGGVSATGENMLRCIEKVGHPDFGIWYDAGNIIHYTGRDPVAELEPIAKYVSGFCAKDCGKERGEVMMQFGEGRVDFTRVFRRLKSAGFNGPVMIECCAQGSPSEVLRNIKANAEYLGRILRKL